MFFLQPNLRLIFIKLCKKFKNIYFFLITGRLSDAGGTYLLSDASGNGYLPHTPTQDTNYDTSPTSISQGSRAFGSSWRNSQTPQPPNNYATGTRR